MKDLLAELARSDTPTICNALELIAPQTRRGGFTLEPLVSAPDYWRAAEGQKAICGRACTARIASADPAQRSAEDTQALKFGYYSAIHTASSGVPIVMVIEDVDPIPRGAFWGEVHTALHRALGAVGCVTNGTIRDLDDLDPDFLLLGGRVGPSHAFVHWVDYGQGATVHGMPVQESDVVHADKHGAVVIPEKALDKLPDAIAEMAEREAPMLALARKAKRLELNELAGLLAISAKGSGA